MPRKKTDPTICPWLTAKPDNKEKRFVQLGNTLLLSEPFQDLCPGARLLYLSMCMESAGRRCFTFPQSAAKKYGIPSTSLRRYIEELIEQGFLTRSSGKNLRVANQYGFSLSWKLHPAPHKRGTGMATCSISDPKWYKGSMEKNSLVDPYWASVNAEIDGA